MKNIPIETVAEHVASQLLEVGAIQLRPKQPFKWSSGWNSPIYCDNRLTLSFPETRSFIKEQLVNLIKDKFTDAEAIAGVATAGIPQGSLIADALNMPFLYVRSSPKGHGMENLIEGKVVEGQKVVVIEDLISTGGSSLKAAEAMRKAGFNVLGMVAVFTYGFQQAAENFKQAGLPLHCLSDYETLLQVATSQNYIQAEAVASLQAWRKSPETWGK